MGLDVRREAATLSVLSGPQKLWARDAVVTEVLAAKAAQTMATASEERQFASSRTICSLHSDASSIAASATAAWSV